MPKRAEPAKPARREMSEEHKAALAEGREHGAAVRRYLEALAAKPVRRGRPRASRDAAAVLARIGHVEERLRDAGGLERLRLIQERIDLRAELADTEPTGPEAAEMRGLLEERFVEVAAMYSLRKGLTRAAWREAGVPSRVLDEAGIR